jgi:hypothetical protein
MSRDCPDCMARAEAFRRHGTYRIESIRRVLECHALGAEVIALKDPKYERLNALHALEALQHIEKELIALGALPNTAVEEVMRQP